MPLEFPLDAPGAILKTMIADDWGDAVLRLPRSSARTIEEAAASFAADKPFRVVYPTLQDILGGNLVGDRSAQGWRCLLRQNDQILAQLETDPNGEPVAIHLGEAKDGIARAMALADQVEGRTFMDAVEVPALKLCALRLRAPGASLREIEYLIPYDPDATGLPLNTVTPVAEAMTLLIPRARDILAMSEADPLSGG